MPREPIYGLSSSDRSRVRDTIEDFENRRRPGEGNALVQPGEIPSHVMRMTTAISWGETGLAMMVKPSRKEDGTLEWNPISDGQYQVAMIGGNVNRIDKGAYVQVVLTAHGWVIVNSWTMGYLSSVDPIPFGVYAVRDNTGDGTTFQGHLRLSYPYEVDNGDNDADLLPWEMDYVFGCQHDTDLARTERSPLGTVIKGLGQQGFAGVDDGLNRLIPVQTSLPAWAAYDTEPDDSIPADVLEGLGWETAEHPNAGERWGPVVGTGFKLKRTATVLPLYWWEWVIAAQSEIQVITLTNQPAGQTFRYVLDGIQSADLTVTMNGATIQGHLEAMSNIGSGNVSVSGSAGGPYTITFQGDLALQDISDGSIVPTSGGSSGSVQGYVTTTQAGRDEIRRQMISPNGWWGDWGWQGWGWSGEYPYWSWWYTGVSSTYFGRWGYGWWNGRWGGYPPASTDIVYTGTDPPDPPEGTLTRYCVHSYIVWQYGWKVLSVNQDKEICKIIGDLKFERSQVVVNADITDCPTYDGPGANPGT